MRSIEAPIVPMAEAGSVPNPMRRGVGITPQVRLQYGSWVQLRQGVSVHSTPKKRGAAGGRIAIPSGRQAKGNPDQGGNKGRLLHPARSLSDLELTAPLV
jgi:hypothetical protein